MNNHNPTRASNKAPTGLHSRAEDNLRFIRDAMEGATSFTGVSGKGLLIAGLSALGATWLAERQATQEAWLVIWMFELMFAGGVNLYLTIEKTARQGGILLSSSGKRLLRAFIPSMIAGGLLTLSFFLNDNISLLPGVWLAIYGAAVITAGAYSVRLVPVMGVMFMLVGALVLLTQVPAALVFGLAMGIGHLGFGAVIWRYHGG